MSILKIKLLRPDAQAPKRETIGSAGYDIKACIDAPVVIKAGAMCKITTGIAIELVNNNYVGLLFARSSLGTKFGVLPANGVGVIDSDYRGEIVVVLKNTSDAEFIVNQGDRVAQLLIVPVAVPDIEICDELGETQRGAGGFGSTGRR